MAPRRVSGEAIFSSKRVTCSPATVAWSAASSRGAAAAVVSCFCFSASRCSSRRLYAATARKCLQDHRPKAGVDLFQIGHQLVLGHRIDGPDLLKLAHHLLQGLGIGLAAGRFGRRRRGCLRVAGNRFLQGCCCANPRARAWSRSRPATQDRKPWRPKFCEFQPGARSGDCPCCPQTTWKIPIQ